MSFETEIREVLLREYWRISLNVSNEYMNWRRKNPDITDIGTVGTRFDELDKTLNPIREIMSLVQFHFGDKKTNFVEYWRLGADWSEIARYTGDPPPALVFEHDGRITWRDKDLTPAHIERIAIAMLDALKHSLDSSEDETP